jgi:hypothetical protein
VAQQSFVVVTARLRWWFPTARGLSCAARLPVAAKTRRQRRFPMARELSCVARLLAAAKVAKVRGQRLPTARGRLCVARSLVMQARRQWFPTVRERAHETRLFAVM